MLEKRTFSFYKLTLGGVMQIFIFVVAFGVTAPESNALNQRWCDKNPFSPHCDQPDHDAAAENIALWEVEVFFNDIGTIYLDGNNYLPYSTFDTINDVSPHDVCAYFGYGDGDSGDEHWGHDADVDNGLNYAAITCSNVPEEPKGNGGGKGRNR